MRWRRLSVAVLVGIASASTIPRPDAARAQERGDEGAGWGSADWQQDGLRLGAEGSNSGDSAEVGAEASLRLDQLVPVETSGDDDRRIYTGPASTGGGGGGGRDYGAPYRCRYVDTGRRSASGVIEIVSNCGTRARTGLGGGWYQTLDTIYVDPTAPEAPADPPPVELVDPATLAAAARSRMVFPPPVPRTSPSLEAGTVAQLPTHFWVEGWGEVTESATAGPVTAWVTATPLRQEWRIQDSVRGAGETVTCEGPGSPPAGLTAGGAPPPCGWTPRHSSAGQNARGGAAGEPCFPTRVTVTWGVAWRSNIGPGGDLGLGTGAADVCLVVAEVQAVLTDAG